MTEHTTETLPQAPINLTDPSSVFMVLEELGIAYMQNFWVTHVEPDNAKAPELKAQYEEFFEDCVHLFSNPSDSRLMDGTWAGLPMAQHLAPAWKLNATPENVSSIIKVALLKYIESLQGLIQKEIDQPASVTPEGYVQFMTMWARYMAGDTNTPPSLNSSPNRK